MVIFWIWEQDLGLLGLVLDKERLSLSVRILVLIMILILIIKSEIGTLSSISSSLLKNIKKVIILKLCGSSIISAL
jgi:hypothetical protein